MAPLQLHLRWGNDAGDWPGIHGGQLIWSLSRPKKETSLNPEVLALGSVRNPLAFAPFLTLWLPHRLPQPSAPPAIPSHPISSPVSVRKSRGDWGESSLITTATEVRIHQIPSPVLRATTTGN